MKKGQVSYFILVAVTLVVVMTVLLYIFSTQDKIEVVTQGSPIPAMPAIQTFVETCVDLVATKGIYHIAYQGGYVNPKGDALYAEPGDTRRTHHYTTETVLPVAADGKDLLLRPLADIEQVLSHYVLVHLDECLDFSTFEQQGLTVQKPQLDFLKTGFESVNTRVSYAADAVQARTTITDEQIDLELTYPILIASKQGQALLTKATTSLDFRLGRLHTITAKLLTDAPQYNPYDLYQHCKKFGARDGLINIYLDYNQYYQDHGLFVVDAQPLNRGFTPLRFQVGVLNQNITGVCTA